MYFTTKGLKEDYVNALKKRFGDPLPEDIIPDIVFKVEKRYTSKKRVDGQLIVGNKSFPVLSGSRGYKPLPSGFYYCHKLQSRPFKYEGDFESDNKNYNEEAKVYTPSYRSRIEEMKLGVAMSNKVIPEYNNGKIVSTRTEGWSMYLEPFFPTDRTELRIHPDGGPVGTAGCIGIINEKDLECFKELRFMLTGKDFLILESINIIPAPAIMDIPTENMIA